MGRERMMTQETREERLIRVVRAELTSARMKFPAFNNSHEGYAVILEELDELWDAIKTNQRLPDQRREAIQVVAMALRFCLDLCGG
jgi:NTP pyrophosphatase (non-canonical NTP hydrolase)